MNSGQSLCNFTERKVRTAQGGKSFLTEGYGGLYAAGRKVQQRKYRRFTGKGEKVR